MTAPIRNHGSGPGGLQGSSTVVKYTPSAFESFVNFFGLVALPFTPDNRKGVNEQLAVDIVLLKKKLAQLQDAIKKINEFVSTRDELAQLCKEYTERYADYIVVHQQPTEKETHSKDIIEQTRVLKNRIVYCESYLTESILFINRHPEVYDCFSKYVLQAAQSNPHFTAELKKIMSDAKVSGIFQKCFPGDSAFPLIEK